MECSDFSTREAATCLTFLIDTVVAAPTADMLYCLRLELEQWLTKRSCQRLFPLGNNL